MNSRSSARNRADERANARLNAAAPDLLAVLQGLYDSATHGGRWLNDGQISQIRAAITTATGESPKYSVAAAYWETLKGDKR